MTRILTALVIGVVVCVGLSKSAEKPNEYFAVEQRWSPLPGKTAIQYTRERSTKVPLIVVPPKKRLGQFAAGGARCDQPVGLIDLYPTLVDLCGIDGPDELDGQSLVPLLQDPGAATDRLVVTMFNPGNASLRTDRYRYIQYADGSEELYDHTEDPHEWKNLADSREHREIRKLFRNRLSSVTSHSRRGRTP